MEFLITQFLASSSPCQTESNPVEFYIVLYESSICCGIEGDFTTIDDSRSIKVNNDKEQN